MLYQAGLFDLDGVVLDTEGQYTRFWKSQFQRYLPEQRGLELEIKGQTLTQIFDKYFHNQSAIQGAIAKALHEFEAQMPLPYIAGFEGFYNDLKRHGLRTAIVTSSDRAKMECVARKRPELCQLFDCVLLAEDFARSKPDPDCYLKGAACLGVSPVSCLVFEDSINGLRAGRASDATVVGLATTNGMEVVCPLCDVAIPDFTGMTYDGLLSLL